MMSTKTETLPVSEVITVRKFVELYKSEKWWAAVVWGESFGRRSIFLYLWIKKKGETKWKRKQKFTIGSRKNWEDLKKAVEELMELAGI